MSGWPQVNRVQKNFNRSRSPIQRQGSSRGRIVNRSSFSRGGFRGGFRGRDDGGVRRNNQRFGDSNGQSAQFRNKNTYSGIGDDNSKQNYNSYPMNQYHGMQEAGMSMGNPSYGVANLRGSVPDQTAAAYSGNRNILHDTNIYSACEQQLDQGLANANQSERDLLSPVLSQQGAMEEMFTGLAQGNVSRTISTLTTLNRTLQELIKKTAKQLITHMEDKGERVLMSGLAAAVASGECDRFKNYDLNSLYKELKKMSEFIPHNSNQLQRENQETYFNDLSQDKSIFDQQQEMRDSRGALSGKDVKRYSETEFSGNHFYRNPDEVPLSGHHLEEQASRFSPRREDQLEIVAAHAPKPLVPGLTGDQWEKHKMSERSKIKSNYENMSRKENLQIFRSILQTEPPKCNAIQSIDNALTKCYKYNLRASYEAEDVHKPGGMPLYTGALSIGGIFMARCFGYSKKDLKHEVYTRAYDALTNKTSDELLCQKDTGPENIISEDSRKTDPLRLAFWKLMRFVLGKAFQKENAVICLQQALTNTNCSLLHEYIPEDICLPNGRPFFKGIVKIGNIVVGIGKSSKKKDARRDAYISALNRLQTKSLDEVISGLSDTDVPSEIEQHAAGSLGNRRSRFELLIEHVRENFNAPKANIIVSLDTKSISLCLTPTCVYRRSHSEGAVMCELYLDDIFIAHAEAWSRKEAQTDTYRKAWEVIAFSSIDSILTQSKQLKGDEKMEVDVLDVVVKGGRRYDDSNVDFLKRLKVDLEQNLKPIDDLILIEKEQWAGHRTYHAFMILNRSASACKMLLEWHMESFGEKQRCVLYLQKQPVGTGISTKKMSARNIAAADALFNRFYKTQDIIQIMRADDSSHWISWAGLQEHSYKLKNSGAIPNVQNSEVNPWIVMAAEDIIQKHLWNNTLEEVIFGPGLPVLEARDIGRFALTMNLKFEQRQNREGSYYAISKELSPQEMVACLKQLGRESGKMRLVSKEEIKELKDGKWCMYDLTTADLLSTGELIPANGTQESSDWGRSTVDLFDDEFRPNFNMTSVQQWQPTSQNQSDDNLYDQYKFLDAQDRRWSKDYNHGKGRIRKGSFEDSCDREFEEHYRSGDEFSESYCLPSDMSPHELCNNDLNIYLSDRHLNEYSDRFSSNMLHHKFDSFSEDRPSRELTERFTLNRAPQDRFKYEGNMERKKEFSNRFSRTEPDMDNRFTAGRMPQMGVIMAQSGNQKEQNQLPSNNNNNRNNLNRKKQIAGNRNPNFNNRKKNANGKIQQPNSRIQNAHIKNPHTAVRYQNANITNLNDSIKNPHVNVNVKNQWLTGKSKTSTVEINRKLVNNAKTQNVRSEGKNLVETIGNQPDSKSNVKKHRVPVQENTKKPQATLSGKNINKQSTPTIQSLSSVLAKLPHDDFDLIRDEDLDSVDMEICD